jgi:PAS domain S-box-containing protein
MQRDATPLDRWGLAEQSARFGVWELDPVRQLVHYSPQWKRMLGYDGTEGPDPTATWRARVHPDDLPAMLEALGAYLQGGTPEYAHEFRLRAADGGWHWVLSRSRVVERDGAGAPLRAIGTLQDITDRREAEALRVERDRAHAASEARTGFLARMSHELRTPLNAILGFAQLLEQQIGEPQADLAAQRRHVKQIELAGWSLLRMVEDVLDLSRAEAGLLAMASTEVALEPLLRSVIAGMAGAASARRIALRLGEVPAAACVRADAGRLAQVVAQLVSNAIRYGRDGGRVDIAAAPGAGSWRIAVADDGVGIAAARLPQVFEPFCRDDACGARQGTGMGLALARSLARRMGGELEASSTEGAGSCFVLELPAAGAVELKGGAR